MEISLKVVEKTDNKKTVIEYAPALIEAEFTTTRLDSAGKLTFSTVEDEGIAIKEGSQIRFKVDGKNVFKGYVFTAERSKNRKVSYTAYDQLRYLKAKASYLFEAMSLDEIIRQIATDFNLKIGDLADTGYKIPSMVKDNTECLSIIFEALMKTTVETGKIFVFYDDFGELTLKEVKKMRWNRLVGDNSLLYDYSYKRDIDSETYNRVKLVRPNESTGRADTYVYEDTDTQKQWGILQYYETVDENMNAAQIDEMCKTYLKYYNKVWQTLKIKALSGFPEIRAGWVIPIRISAIDVAQKQRFFLAEKIVHHFSGNTHTMDIEIKNFNEV